MIYCPTFIAHFQWSSIHNEILNTIIFKRAILSNIKFSLHIHYIKIDI